jgi:hypothetical protein
MTAKEGDLHETGRFSSENGTKSRVLANESTDFVRAGGCNGRFWAMIMNPFGPGLRRSAGGARVRGRPRPAGPSRIVEPNAPPARLIHEPTVRTRCKRQPTRS